MRNTLGSIPELDLENYLYLKKNVHVLDLRNIYLLFSGEWNLCIFNTAIVVSGCESPSPVGEDGGVFSSTSFTRPIARGRDDVDQAIVFKKVSRGKKFQFGMNGWFGTPLPDVERNLTNARPKWLRQLSRL